MSVNSCQLYYGDISAEVFDSLAEAQKEMQKEYEDVKHALLELADFDWGIKEAKKQREIKYEELERKCGFYIHDKSAFCSSSQYLSTSNEF